VKYVIPDDRKAIFSVNWSHFSLNFLSFSWVLGKTLEMAAKVAQAEATVIEVPTVFFLFVDVLE
jgi:hypothetical protein